MNKKQRSSWCSVIGPGILVAATGVGAGDLLTASMAGSKVGLGILWAAVVGALLKWTLNEGIARWQMATETALLEGWVTRLGSWIQWVFLAYFFIWTRMVHQRRAGNHAAAVRLHGRAQALGDDGVHWRLGCRWLGWRLRNCRLGLRVDPPVPSRGWTLRAGYNWEGGAVFAFLDSETGLIG